MNVANGVSRVVEEVCDLCAIDKHKEECRIARVEHPEYFADNGKGNLLDCNGAYIKHVRATLLQMPKSKILEIECGFCSEPIRICANHLRELLKKLE